MLKNPFTVILSVVKSPKCKLDTCESSWPSVSLCPPVCMHILAMSLMTKRIFTCRILMMKNKNFQFFPFLWRPFLFVFYSFKFLRRLKLEKGKESKGRGDLTWHDHCQWRWLRHTLGFVGGNSSFPCPLLWRWGGCAAVRAAVLVRFFKHFAFSFPSFPIAAL